jgi:hypothetical protein
LVRIALGERKPRQVPAIRTEWSPLPPPARRERKKLSYIQRLQRDIRIGELWLAGVPVAVIARRFGLSTATVKRIAIERVRRRLEKEQRAARRSERRD